jgi:hypothetical protein
VPDTPKEQLALSVQDRTTVALAAEAPLTFLLASIADGVPDWPSKARDIKLDDFWRTESMLAGAVSSMCAKVAALDFKLTGPAKSVARARTMLLGADFGLGWVGFASMTVQDLLTQDNGAFIELLRAKGAGPTAPVLGLAHLDSQRVERTGDPAFPAIYTDLLGKPHTLAWYQVVALTDLPTPREARKGYGYCAVSRVLRAAQVMRDIALYKRQKVSGKRAAPGIIFVQGMRRGAVEDALKQAYEAQRQEGNTLYTKPIILASPDAGQPLDAKLIELAGLPDGYDEDTIMKWYITTLALDFGTDYTEFAPLPGGNLGSGMQTTEMAARSRGKGPGVILQLFEYALNWHVLPRTVEFQFASTDPTAERDRIELALLRARERAMRIHSTELTPEMARQLAVAAGDAPEEFLAPAAPRPEEQRVEDIVRAVGDFEASYRQVEALLCRHP